jgi:maltoporin
MRRALQSWALSGLVATALLATEAFAQESTEATPSRNTEEPRDTAQAPPATPATSLAVQATSIVATASKPKFGDVSVSGYFRGGFGASNQKGRMTCFALANPQGLVSKYRLGNECEVWAESHFTAVVYAGDDDSVATFHFMPTVYIPTTYIGYSPTATTTSPAQFTTSTGATVSFPNLYVDIKGISWLLGGTAWAGTRYYKRESVYISDFFYWNPSGVGAGVEDIQLNGELRLSYGAFAVDGEPAQPASPTDPPLTSQTDFGLRNDLQLRGIRPWDTSELQIGFQYIANYSNNPVTHSGWGVTVQHVQKVAGGSNKLAVQYGKGGGTGFGTLARFYYPDFSVRHDPAELRIRVVDVLTIQPVEWLGAQLAAVYQHDNLGSQGTTDWYSAGGRVSYAFSKHAKLLGEAGVDYVKKSIGADPQYLAKFTIAPTIAAGRELLTRPELRLFYTYAVWNASARGASVDSGRIYTATSSLSGATFGLQAETWW